METLSKEKQIEEIKKVLMKACKRVRTPQEDYMQDRYAEALYNAGYCKQSEPFSCGHEKDSEWISVDERLPEKGLDYLCRCIIRDNIDYPFFMVLRYILIDENPHFQHECDNGLKVTHWMPLPEAPKMRKEDEGK